MGTMTIRQISPDSSPPGAHLNSDQYWLQSDSPTLATYSITALRLYEPI